MKRVREEATVVVSCETSAKAVPYVDALVAVGVEAEQIVVVTSEDGEGEMATLGARSVGVMLCGGPDLEPWRYGEQRRDDAPLYANPGLDEVELSLLQGAWEARTPVWAICRGMQAVNVFFGGTLYQDIPTQLPETGTHDVPKPSEHLAHTVEINGSQRPLTRLLKHETVSVNTRHHQAVKDLGEGLTLVGNSPDGILEALEWDGDDWWMWGVQWHPENLLELAIQRQLWRRFANAIDETTKERHS